MAIAAMFWALPLWAADEHITGNLTVDGTTSVAGDTLDLGTATISSVDYSALSFDYNDSTYTITFSATRAGASFLWQDDAGGTAKAKMKLDANNVLTLQASNYTSGSVGKIILTPSTSGSQITMDGNALLTQAAAASTYLPLNPASMAVGSSTSATGTYAAALGENTTAQSYASLVLGRYNVLQGTGGSWVATDDAFVIGNGTGTSSRSNAFAVKKNGDTTVTGKLTAAGTGGVLFGGTYGQGSIPAEGAGTRMMWYPKKGAFRVGGVDSYSSSYWNDSNIGDYSFAVGFAPKASGPYSSAIGSYASATGNGSTAFTNSYAEGIGSVAMGLGGTATGDLSLALGSVAATSYGSVVLGYGSVEDTSQNQTDWISNDQLFVIGNGYYDLSNALVMRKNANMRTGGTLEAKGVIRCAPGGDLSMGSFTASPSGLGNPATLNAALKYSGE